MKEIGPLSAFFPVFLLSLFIPSDSSCSGKLPHRDLTLPGTASENDR